MSALWPLQAALVTRLKGTAGVTAYVAQRIYDGEAPQGATLPYIVTGDATGEPSNVLDDKVGEVDTIICHVWSDYRGSKEGMMIVTAMDAALTAPLTLAGWGTARLRPDFVTTIVEQDGVRHMPRRYRLMTFRSA